ncbi:MAG TPA: hypothetical protein PKN32_07080 [Bacteroidales bacterium]|jgi:hypothetical protein|nr:hypothetical protein [Bacteroidales bacterium]
MVLKKNKSTNWCWAACIWRVQLFYDSYRYYGNNYHMNNLNPIPSDEDDLWTKPTLTVRDIV